MITVDSYVKSKTDLSVRDRTSLLAAFKLKGINMLPDDITAHTVIADGVKVSIPKKVKFSVSQKSIEKFLKMRFWIVPVTTIAGGLVYHIYHTTLAATRGTVFLLAKMRDPSDGSDPKEVKPVQQITGETLLESTSDGEPYWHYNWKPSSIVAKL